MLDAVTGQNAVMQAKAFAEVCQLDGVILTKLDGTAKGGVVISICESLHVPVRFVGVGEGMDHLQAFDANSLPRRCWQTTRIDAKHPVFEEYNLTFCSSPYNRYGVKQFCFTGDSMDRLIELGQLLDWYGAFLLAPAFACAAIHQ